MAAQNPDDLIDFLSEREGASASRSPEPGPLAEIHADLETLKNRLSRPEPVDPFSDEPDCAGAVGRAADLASDTSQPTRIGPAGAEEGADEIQIAPAAEFPLGSLGKYQLIAKLGEGGMGTVYRARQIRLERLVALKVLPAARLKDPQAVARFEREMRAVGTLQHPHIVAAYDAGEIDGTHYLEMELVEGIDLGALAKNLGTLPIAEACELIRQAALGLQHAHEHALVHRDLKPSNLMLARTAEPDAAPIVKILDLGLALLEGGQIEGAPELTSTGQVMGTIDYMAPEQGTDTHKVDGRADIYSLGATLYRLLTGKVPFAQYDTTIKKLTALATREPPPVVSLRPGCPVPLAALVQQMLAKDPAARPSSAAALVGALAPFARGADLRRLLGQPLGRQRDDLPSGGTAVGCNTAPSAYDETNLGAVPGRETIPAAAPPVAAASSGEATENPFGIDWSDRLPSARLVPRHKAISLRARLAVGALAAAIVAGGVYLLSTRNPSRRHNVPVAAPKEKTEPETVEQPAPPVEDHERSAATWVLANGGTVKLDGREQQIHDAAFLPERPFRLTGITLPESYGGVGLTETLQNLPHVTELAMGGNLVGDAQAAIVRDMPELVSLNLTHCPVGDDGLQHLVGHTRLQHVTLYCALNVRDDGLKHLSGLTELVTVHVGGTQVTDEGFKHLAGLTRLKYLSADNARVTGAGFRYLTHCKEIELAHLAHSGATDEGVAEICKFSSLRKLNLQYTAITDACVDLLCNHPNLIHINLGGSRVSAEAFTRLRKARPNCEVFGQP